MREVVPLEDGTVLVLPHLAAVFRAMGWRDVPSEYGDPVSNSGYYVVLRPPSVPHRK